MCIRDRYQRRVHGKSKINQSFSRLTDMVIEKQINLNCRQHYPESGDLLEKKIYHDNRMERLRFIDCYYQICKNDRSQLGRLHINHCEIDRRSVLTLWKLCIKFNLDVSINMNNRSTIIIHLMAGNNVQKTKWVTV
eukprot:TRINITY_DN256_c0_g1_i4.p1 TRINITY_DN256_c0_g1~~TRINITY_DN256_c0_g1_i4.p1  ORF type:complete len:136 (+),score=10.41 TRINITY_DN256_c0_g1_i4:171-578(+)